MSIEDCLNEGLLKKTTPDLGQAKASLDMARHKLGLAEMEERHGIHENAVTTAYASMFHTARALLFKDGYKERSHYAVCVYVKEKYSGRIERKYLGELNSLRLQRHELMYGLGKTAEIKAEEAKETISAAKGFLDAVKKIVG